MSEIEQCSTAKIVPPDMNVSGIKFFTDYGTDEIFWSLSRIKMLGGKSVEYIIAERGEKRSLHLDREFHPSHFPVQVEKYQYWDDPDNEQEATRVPVNARHIRNLVMTGCFDRIENVKAVVERYSLLNVLQRDWASNSWTRTFQPISRTQALFLADATGSYLWHRSS